MTFLRNTASSLAIALPCLTLATAATAGGLADPVVPAPVATPAPVMAAPQADWTGFYAGGQLGYGDVDNDLLDDDTNGAIYGVHAGYLYDFGSFVLGGEVDVDGTNIESDAPIDGVDVEAIARAKVLLGYDAGVFMPYLAVGAAQASLSGDVDAEDTGSFAGLGMTYQVNDSMRVGAEVLQHEFEEFDDNGDLDIDATTASVRVSFVF